MRYGAVPGLGVPQSPGRSVHCMACIVGPSGAPPLPPMHSSSGRKAGVSGLLHWSAQKSPVMKEKSGYFPREIPSRYSRCVCARGLTLYHLLRSSSTQTYVCGEEDISRKKTLWRVKRQNTITELRGWYQFLKPFVLELGGALLKRLVVTVVNCGSCRGPHAHRWCFSAL